MRWVISVVFLFSMAYGKIYDCFLFFNEWEVLELRLHELYDYVDEFVIVEASEGFRGHPKPYNFEKQKERYARFADKITYIKLKEHIETDDPWTREFWQRNQIMRGLSKCRPDDLILISDLDEYIPGSVIETLYQQSAIYPMIGFQQRMYRWFLNRTTSELWAGTAALRYKHLCTRSPQQIRELVRRGQMTMWQFGWHFTSMGGYERIVDKYCNYSDDFGEIISYEEWQARVNKHPLVEIDATYPQFVQDHIPYLIDSGLIDPS